jgi:hypothetical protein
MLETLFSENAYCRLVLTATTDPSDEFMRLHYRVTNSSASVLYLCDQLYQLSQLAPTPGEPGYELVPDRVYIQVDTQGVHLDKAIMDLSFHQGIRGLDIPFLTRLAPSQEHGHTVQLALPLLPYKVLGLPPGPAAPIPLPLRFSLGYFVGSSEVEKHITEAPTAQGPALCIELFMHRAQQSITIGPFQQPFPVANAVADAAPHTSSSAAWAPWGP